MVEKTAKQPKQLLSDKLISKIAAPPHGNHITYDREIRGFGLRVTSAGVKSFVLNYRVNGRERRYTIGRLDEMTLQQARAEALQLREEIREGKDPLAERAESRIANDVATVGQLANSYLKWAEAKKRATSIRDDKYMLDGIIRPRLSTKPIASITRGDIEEIHSSLSATPYKANRVLALISKMFNLAVSENLRADNPAKGIVKFPEDRRERWLSAGELKRLLRALKKHPSKETANAIRLLIYTGARRGEVLSATWEQFDLKRGVWTKPSHHTKQKKIEHVPLNRTAMKFLVSLAGKPPRKEGFLFPSDSVEGHLTELKGVWKSVCATAKLKGVRVHDLRHSFASHLVSKGVSLQMVGKLLGHSSSQTTQRYAHIDDEALRKATNQFPKLA